MIVHHLRSAQSPLKRGVEVSVENHEGQASSCQLCLQLFQFVVWQIIRPGKENEESDGFLSVLPKESESGGLFLTAWYTAGYCMLSHQ